MVHDEAITNLHTQHTTQEDKSIQNAMGRAATRESRPVRNVKWRSVTAWADPGVRPGSALHSVGCAAIWPGPALFGVGPDRDSTSNFYYYYFFLKFKNLSINTTTSIVILMSWPVQRRCAKKNSTLASKRI